MNSCHTLRGSSFEWISSILVLTSNRTCTQISFVAHSLSCMKFLMSPQVGFAPETFPTDRAGVWFFSRMNSLMVNKI